MEEPKTKTLPEQAKDYELLVKELHKEHDACLALRVPSFKLVSLSASQSLMSTDLAASLIQQHQVMIEQQAVQISQLTANFIACHNMCIQLKHRIDNPPPMSGDEWKHSDN